MRRDGGRLIEGIAVYERYFRFRDVLFGSGSFFSVRRRSLPVQSRWLCVQSGCLSVPARYFPFRDVHLRSEPFVPRSESLGLCSEWSAFRLDWMFSVQKRSFRFQTLFSGSELSGPRLNWLGFCLQPFRFAGSFFRPHRTVPHQIRHLTLHTCRFGAEDSRAAGDSKNLWLFERDISDGSAKPHSSVMMMEFYESGSVAATGRKDRCST
jgi:hypothetical protein